jgi:hypothetical protein
MWGNFFYNVSYAVSTITGCKLSSDKNYITVLGVANSLPVVMLLNKNDGSINTFLTISLVQTYTTAPSFTTSSAVYFEEKDPVDGNGYIYVTFTMSKVF